MIKSLVLLLNMLGLFLLNLLFSGSVSLNMVAPKEVNAGKEFEVEVTLDKGDVSSFARFQQDLPAGLSAQVVDASNADFSFKDQKVRFVWLRLPSQSTVTIRYKVKVNDRLTGNFKLNGKFSYIEDNERKEVLATDQLLAIVPDPSIDPKMLVDINDYQQMATSKLLAAGSANVAAIRQEPYLEGQSNDYIVNILVSKGTADKFAKIEEDIPEGFKAESIDSKDGIFTFKDQKAKFLWMTLPPEQSFVVSYRLVPEDGVGPKELALKGTFSFIQNDATQVIDIAQKSTNLRTLTAQQLEALAHTTSGTTERQDNVSNSYTPDASGGVEIPIKYVGAEKMAEQDRKQHISPTASSSEANMSYTLEPEKGVYYRVQIAAGHKLVNIKRYFRKYKLDAEVRTEQHDGWYKYSVGSFYVYKDAHDYRSKLWATTPIDDAFVAAYNNGKRITVQEALMITNHKWYK
ncbi:MAG TPA: SPOR domain-containing protein [Williamwhitmania sp.]|nr:SPOR domain-containing protein [Williamwhitmania sp.]